LLKDYNNWCPEVYRSVFIDRFNDNFIRVAPCCQANAQLESVEGFDFTTSPYLTQLREQFDLGQQPSACDNCWNVERHGHKSRRQSAIEFFQTLEPDYSVELQSIDHSATWACNLACIMCGPKNSSLWAKQNNLSRHELHQMGRLFQKTNNILNNVDLSQVKKIHFNGGEPLLNDDQLGLLLKLEEQDVLKNVFISYNTNGTVMPSKKIIELWNKTRLVKIFFSIDAVGPAFEYIRWPASWDDTSKNILNMKADLPGNVMFGFNVTVGSYNLLELPKLCEWFDQNISHNRDGDESDFCWQFASNFDPKDLPQEVKRLCIDQLKNNSKVTGIVNYLKSTLNYSAGSSCIDALDSLDAKRDTDWKKSLLLSNYVE
jgi:hypothetical protein